MIEVGLRETGVVVAVQRLEAGKIRFVRIIMVLERRQAEHIANYVGLGSRRVLYNLLEEFLVKRLFLVPDDIT